MHKDAAAPPSLSTSAQAACLCTHCHAAFPLCTAHGSHAFLHCCTCQHSCSASAFCSHVSSPTLLLSSVWLSSASARQQCHASASQGFSGSVNLHSLPAACCSALQSCALALLLPLTSEWNEFAFPSLSLSYVRVSLPLDARLIQPGFYSICITHNWLGFTPAACFHADS